MTSRKLFPKLIADWKVKQNSTSDGVKQNKKVAQRRKNITRTWPTKTREECLDVVR